MKSILQDEKECYLCRRLYGVKFDCGLEEHHIFYGTANRRLSEEHGLKAWLCHDHHTGCWKAVHFNKETDNKLKEIAQKKFEETHSREEFMEIFGRNYIYE